MEKRGSKQGNKELVQTRCRGRLGQGFWVKKRGFKQQAKYGGRQPEPAPGLFKLLWTAAREVSDWDDCQRGRKGPTGCL